jgi:hypothetical protein
MENKNTKKHRDFKVKGGGVEVDLANCERCKRNQVGRRELRIRILETKE